MINSKLRGFSFTMLYIREKNIMKRQELNFFGKITSQQRLHTCLTPVAVLWSIQVGCKCNEYLNLYTAEAFFRQKQWFSSITVCCCHVGSRWSRELCSVLTGSSRVLSSFPSHVLAAGGHILDPSVCHKTKGKAVGALPGCLPVWEICAEFSTRTLQRRFWVSFVPSLKGSLFLSHSVQEMGSC